MENKYGAKLNNQNACKDREESDSDNAVEQGHASEQELSQDVVDPVPAEASTLKEAPHPQSTFCKHADLLEQGSMHEANRLRGNVIGAGLGSTNTHLWMGFAFFALLMFWLQPAELVPATAKCRFNAALSTDPSICTQVCK